MKLRLTNKSVDLLKPGTALYSARDTEIKGFLLRISPSGEMVYYLDYRNINGLRRSYRIGSHGTLKLTQARDLAHRLAADVAKGTDIQEERRRLRREGETLRYKTLSAFLLNKYRPWVTAERETGEQTLKRIRYNFAPFMEWPLSEINAWVIGKWRTEQLRAGKAKSTINRDLVALKAAISKAVEWGVIEIHPLASIKPLKTDNRRVVRYLDDHERTRLNKALNARDERIKGNRASANGWRTARGYGLLPELEGWDYGDHLTPMVILTLYTGLRRKEIFHLKWENINFRNKTLTVDGRITKNGLTRHLPLHEKALSAVSGWQDQSNGVGQALMFPGKGGLPLENVRKAWSGVLHDANITAFRWHDLRHDFASQLVMQGVPLNTVRELLGHQDLTTTLRYAHLAPEHNADAIAQLA